jgi:CBS domain containing-hemolysin-like protein
MNAPIRHHGHDGRARIHARYSINEVYTLFLSYSLSFPPLHHSSLLELLLSHPLLHHSSLSAHLHSPHSLSSHSAVFALTNHLHHSICILLPHHLASALCISVSASTAVVKPRLLWRCHWPRSSSAHIDIHTQYHRFVSLTISRCVDQRDAYAQEEERAGECCQYVRWRSGLIVCE